VYYRVAIMSKDGDSILKETPQACHRILEVLEKKRARYRSGAPLDTRWLSAGWSSHFEFADELGRRISTRRDSAAISEPPRLTCKSFPRLECLSSRFRRLTRSAAS
jgi:hypothetical protein